MKDTTTIRNFYNQIIGYIETDLDTGNAVGKNFYHQIVGYYDKKRDVTMNFYHQVITRGNTLSGLVAQEEMKK